MIDPAPGKVVTNIALGGKPEYGAAAGKVVATVPIGAGVDGAGYDAASGDAFASNADGTLTVIHQDGRGR